MTNATIEKRPAKVNEQKKFGHWEVDAVLSSRGQDRTCVVTFLERQSRVYWAIKVHNRTKEDMATGFQRFMKSFGRTVKKVSLLIMEKSSRAIVS